MREVQIHRLSIGELGGKRGRLYPTNQKILDESGLTIGQSLLIFKPTTENQKL